MLHLPLFHDVFPKDPLFRKVLIQPCRALDQFIKTLLYSLLMRRKENILVLTSWPLHLGVTETLIESATTSLETVST